MTKQETVGVILLGDPPSIHAVWPNEPFLWRFDEGSLFQPPMIDLVSFGIDYHWAVKIEGINHFPDHGDIIRYGENQTPICIVSSHEAHA